LKGGYTPLFCRILKMPKKQAPFSAEMAQKIRCAAVFPSGKKAGMENLPEKTKKKPHTRHMRLQGTEKGEKRPARRSVSHYTLSGSP